MRQLIFLLFFLVSLTAFGQDEQLQLKNAKPSQDAVPKKTAAATIDMYRIISQNRDTTYVDTALTIQCEYKFNYLRRDNFGLQPFANEGQPYNVLQFSLVKHAPFPSFGYRAKHFSYIEAEQVNYYSVATPLTDLYFKSVMEQGQTLDAFITLNTSEKLNFSIAYRGLRSLGKYINQLSSIGNFRFTTSYHSTGMRYIANFHFTGQDILNGENGGIVSEENFESDDPKFKNRARLDVYFKDAESFLKGKRFFLDHQFRINSARGANNLYISHRFNFENKDFEWRQPTIATSTIDDNNQQLNFNRFGTAYVPANIHDRAKSNQVYNRVGVSYENSTLGTFTFFGEHFRTNYYFDKVIILNSQVIPSSINQDIAGIGGQYNYRKNKWTAAASYSTSVTNTPYFSFDGSATYSFDDRNRVGLSYSNLSRVPDHLFNLHQSSYVTYNWYNDFANEKSNTVGFDAFTQWANLSLQYRTINDYLYFSDNGIAPQQLVSPNQFDGTINYISAKLSREFKWRKWGFDNTLLYQKTTQDQNILNVPEFVTRNTLYYSEHFFKRALYIQTGITLNYFTSYYADGYNPLIGDFYVQEQKKIGDFPMLDFFINARVRQTRIFLKAEHFNSAWTGNDFYSAPGYPYRDFLVRFGLVWNFFK